MGQGKEFKDDNQKKNYPSYSKENIEDNNVVTQSTKTKITQITVKKK